MVGYVKVFDARQNQNKKTFSEWVQSEMPNEFNLYELYRKEIELLEVEKAKSTWMNSDQAAEYLGIAKSTLYKYTHGRLIPTYKPSPRVLRFLQSDLDNFIRNKRVKSMDELDVIASDYLVKKI